MFFDGNDWLGLTPDEVFDRISRLECPEEQAHALILLDNILTPKQFLALARKVAAPTTPRRKYLFDMLVARQKKLVQKRVAAVARKAKALAKAANKLAPPNLFERF